MLGCDFWRQNETTVFMKARPDCFVLSKTGYCVRLDKSTDTLAHHAAIVNRMDFDAGSMALKPRGRSTFI